MPIEDFDKAVFIVGAPRCGTTTMSKMLRTHPEVAVPFVKEPHYFAQHDLSGLSEADLRSTVESDYLDRFFGPPPPGKHVLADGSVSYLYVPDQIAPVLKLWPNSRFIIGVRDPMSLLPSLHQRLIYVGDETIMRFEEAWAATPDRAAGRRIPRSCIDPRFLRYDEAGRFGTYVEQLFAAVGRERCFVSVFDDLAADPAGQYRRIMNFIGLEPQDKVHLSVARGSRGIRYPWLQRLLKRPPRVLHPYLAGIQYRQRFDGGLNGQSNGSKPKRSRLLSLRKRLLEWNEVEAEDREPIALDVQQEIRGHFAGEVEHLGDLIGRDLSHWLQPRPDR